jgi:hypothetical protein
MIRTFTIKVAPWPLIPFRRMSEAKTWLAT